ncbi:MAG: hypothetical protein H0T87_13905 [Gammaproteobacteria bacterium]|nr:hypothetical protein [Gammaproteobacteria bacterium]
MIEIKPHRPIVPEFPQQGRKNLSCLVEILKLERRERRIEAIYAYTIRSYKDTVS